MVIFTAQLKTAQSIMIKLKIPAFLHQFASPRLFFFRSKTVLLWLYVVFLVTVVSGLYLGPFVAPPDYQQGESVRIIYIHVPAAWNSMFLYSTIAFCSAIFLIWKIKLADIIAMSCAPIGAAMTFLALITGSLWGKPMWGTWWVWDARLTSELILLFIYLGYIALRNAFDDVQKGGKAAAILGIVGVINLPIIHYSVVWWNTLHQGATVSQFGKPKIAIEMLTPLLLMAIAFTVFAIIIILRNARAEVLLREQKTTWAKQVAQLS